VSAKKILHIVGLIVAAVGAAMIASAAVAAAYRSPDWPALLQAGAVSLVVGLALDRLTPRPTELTIRESYLIVSLAWLSAAIAGALPFWFAGAAGPLDAFFESISGFTTTGASIFPDPGSLTKGLQFWRGLSQWLGGMGIIVLVVAVLPYLGVGGMQLFRAEVPGPTPERLQPRIKQTATILWRVYVGLTAAQFGLYVVGGMSVFDAATHAFATMPTGGFSPRTESLGYYSGYHQYVTIIFMYLAGVNFSLHYRAIRGRSLRTMLADEEWRFYSVVLLAALAIVITAHLLRGSYDALEETLRASAFQVVSIGTTTGFATADYVAWPAVTQVVLFFLMFVGGMAGSTGGGMKTLRLWAALKQGVVELRKHLHPRAVIVTRVGGRVVPEGVMLNILAFLLLFVASFIVGALLLTILGVDMVTAAGASAAAIGNIGPGLAQVGPAANYAWMPGLGKLVLSLLMLLGRLEIYTILVLFQREFWRR
jgi:trk system potassium uptake protein TrkH